MNWLGVNLIGGAVWFTAAGGLAAVAARMNRREPTPGARRRLHADQQQQDAKVIPLRRTHISGDDGTEMEHG